MINDATKIVICGPTASGKSALALKLAKEIDGVIINFDSQQVYKEIPIMSAQPSEEEKQEASHYLYGIISGKDGFNVANWLNAAIDLAGKLSEKKPLIFVGGTGLYLNALLHGLSPIPDIPDHIRDYVRNIDIAEVARQLATNDSNSNRLRRRLEVKLATGNDIERYYNIPKDHIWQLSDFNIYNLTVPRETLYSNIDERMDWMISNGGLEEIEGICKEQFIDSPISKACGIREFAQHLNANITFDEALSKAKQTTRNYAKRQMTWFRHQLPHHKTDIDNVSLDLILKGVEHKL